MGRGERLAPRLQHRQPALILLGVALLCFFVATGIPQTTNAYQWKAGDVGLARWLRSLDAGREAGEVAPHLLGTWRSGEDSCLIELDRLTIISKGQATAICNYRVYTFAKLSDGRLLTLRDPHRDDVQIAFLTR